MTGAAEMPGSAAMPPVDVIRLRSWDGERWSDGYLGPGPIERLPASALPLCPDLLRYEQLGAADGPRGRLIRAVFWVLRAWPAA